MIAAQLAVLATVVIAGVAGQAAAQTAVPIYARAVDSASPGLPVCVIGRCWENAYTDLQDALDAATPDNSGITEIWVAVGDNPLGYVPSKPTPDPLVPLSVRLVTFTMITGPGGRAIYGGFLGYADPGGGETDRSQRNPEVNETVLTGAGIAPPPDFVCPEPCVFPCRCDQGDCFVPHAGSGCTLPDLDCCELVCCQLPLCCLSNWDEQCADAAHSLCPAALNAYHVVTAPGLDNTARLDGFTITGGLADGNHLFNGPDFSDTARGGGILIGDGQIVPTLPREPVIARCRLMFNTAMRGGGLYTNSDVGAGVRPTLVNLEFRQNLALESDHPLAVNGGDGGGAYSGPGSQELFVNCLFVNNVADRNGAALHDVDGTERGITNSTFAYNITSGTGGGIYFAQDGATPVSMEIANCILWSNLDEGGIDASAQIHVAGTLDITLSNSDVDGGPVPPGVTDGLNNIDADPEFVNQPAGNYRLNACSPCVEKGDDVKLPLDVSDLDEDTDVGEKTPWDLDKNDRTLDSPDGGTTAKVDMGAYEFVPPFCPWDCGDGDGVVEVVDFLALLMQWDLHCTSCDQIGPPGVGIWEFLELLTAWGPCETGGGGQVPTTVEDCMTCCGTEPLVIAECICKVEPCTEGCPPENCQ